MLHLNSLFKAVTFFFIETDELKIADVRPAVGTGIAYYVECHVETQQNFLVPILMRSSVEGKEQVFEYRRNDQNQRFCPSAESDIAAIQFCSES